MLRGIQSDSSVAVGEMVKRFTTWTFDMKERIRTGYNSQQALALSAA